MSENNSYVKYLHRYKFTIGAIIVFVFPAFFFYQYFFTGYSFSKFIGHDFYAWSYRYKYILLDYMSKGEMFWWSPGEACGVPFWSSPFPQTFYPLNLPFSILYKINSGYTYGDHHKYMILGFSIFNLGLYCWLRSFNFRIFICIITTLIFCMCFRLTEIVVFCNTIHTIAWFPIILLGINLILQYERYKLGSILTGFAAYSFLTAGYPYYVYYSIFVIPIYCLLFFNKFFKINLFNSNSKTKWQSFGILVSSFLIALLLAYPYLIKFVQASNLSALRSGISYNYGLYNSFKTINEFFSAYLYPPGASPFSWVYFGTVNLYFIFGAFLISIFSYTKNKVNFKFFVFLLLWIFFIATLGFTNKLPWYDFLWNNLPFFSNFRAWVRTSVITIPFWAFLFGLSFKVFGKSYQRKTYLFSALTLLASCILVLNFQRNTPLSNWMKLYGKNNDIDDFLNNFLLINQYFIGFLVGIIIFLLIKKELQINKIVLTYILPLLLLVSSILDLRNNGMSIWSINGQAWKAFSVHKDLNYQQQIVDNFELNRVGKFGGPDMGGLFSIHIHSGVGSKNYVDLYKNAKLSKNKILLENIMGTTTPKKVFLSTEISYKPSDVDHFVTDSETFESMDGTYKVLSYEPDRLKVSVNLKKDGYLTFIDNWDPDWIARIDSEIVDIELFLTTFKSVKASKGSHVIDFTYEPFHNIFNPFKMRKKMKWYLMQNIKN